MEHKFRSQLQYYDLKHICLVHMTFKVVTHFKLKGPPIAFFV